MSKHIEMMRLAEKVALQSVCKRAQVGAVVVCANGRVETGFNHNGGQCCEGSDGRTLGSTVHAEMAATGMQSGAMFSSNVMGLKTLYVTRQPCIECAKRLTLTGIKTVYYRDADDKVDGIEHLLAHGVTVDSRWMDGQKPAALKPAALKRVQQTWAERNGVKTMNVKLQWATPDADKQVMFMARVSNPENQNSENSRLLHYCMEHGHVSPFEMASVCIEINTTRDIARQILRHRSFSFQEFSQRYQEVNLLGEMVERECRMQDTKNRQNSIECEYPATSAHWNIWQNQVWRIAIDRYEEALRQGIAKEVARALLPEGLTPSRVYMNGTLRSWIFYLKQRLDPTTQKEHREIAAQVLTVLRDVAPVTMTAFFGSADV